MIVKVGRGMLKKRKIIIIVEIVMIVLAISIFGAMAFLSINGKQELANTFTSGCLKITLSDVTDAITLNGAFPITDIEGLEQEESYKFQIKNSCDTETQYKINLESINKQNNTLDSEYVKVALSSNTMDNLIMKLDPKDITMHYLEDAYQSHNLYEGILKANETKEFTLKEWLDYDTTKEEGANKIYQSKIYVVSDSRDEITEKPEIKFTYSDRSFAGTLTEEVSNVKYLRGTSSVVGPIIIE